MLGKRFRSSWCVLCLVALFCSAGGILAGGLGMATVSQPMMMGAPAGATAAITNTTLSPTRKTPLATYFEEAPAAAAPGGLGAVGASLSPNSAAAAAGISNVRLGAGTPPGTRLGDPLMGEALTGGMHLGGPGAAAPGSAMVGDGVGAGQLALGELDKLTAGLNLGAGAVPAQPNSHGTYSPLGGGLSLFGDATLLAPGSSSGPNSTGATSLVGV
jgi:hypothetical protein